MKYLVIVVGDPSTEEDLRKLRVFIQKRTGLIAFAVEERGLCNQIAWHLTGTDPSRRHATIDGWPARREVFE